MTTSEKRNWHAIEGPNGRCACGQQPDGTFKDCAQLLAEEVGRAFTSSVTPASPEASHTVALQEARAENARLTEALEQEREKQRLVEESYATVLEGVKAERDQLREALEQAQRERADLQTNRDLSAICIDQLKAERDQQAGALVTLREALEGLRAVVRDFDVQDADDWVDEMIAKADAALAASAPASTPADHRQGCACDCCDHSEGSDCACDCHAEGLCAASTTEEG
jgi:hypothetical protein